MRVLRNIAEELDFCDAGHIRCAPEGEFPDIEGGSDVTSRYDLEKSRSV